MSVGTIMLISSWVLEGEYEEKWKRMKESPLFWVGISFFLLHILGLLWTSDFNYAFHDLRAKLPVLVIPFVLGSIPAVTRFEFQLVLYSFVFSVVLTSVLNYLIANGVIPSERELQNFRDYSIFISHIRFALMIDFAVFILIYLGIGNFKKFLLFLPIIFWLLYYSYFSQIISGFIYLFILFFLGGLYFIFQSKNKLLKIGLTSGSIILIGIVGFMLTQTIKGFYAIPLENPEDCEKYTVNGNPYTNNNSVMLRENGNLIYSHICDQEIEKEWEKRTQISIDTILPGMKIPLRFTLFRYMTAKGLHKDSLGMSQMSEEDIQNVLHAYTSPLQAEGGIKARVYSLLNDWEEWKLDPNPNDKTLFQRLSYWEAGWHIFKENFLIGVGTGDIQESFDTYYIESESRLNPENRHRSHNQYLTIAVCFGILGLLLFLGFLFLPLILLKKPIEFLHLIFLVLMCLSFLPEDTLETQSGISFFALFYSLFLFRKRA